MPPGTSGSDLRSGVGSRASSFIRLDYRPRSFQVAEEERAEPEEGHEAEAVGERGHDDARPEGRIQLQQLEQERDRRPRGPRLEEVENHGQADAEPEPGIALPQSR